MKPIIVTIVLISSIAGLTACSTGVMSPNDGSPTMAQAYDSALNNETTFEPNKSDNTGENNTSTILAVNNAALPSLNAVGMPASVISTLDSQFPTLPNPQSVMYIFGHYAGNEQLPVPGHFTAFPLYTETHYALPDEILRPYNDGQFSEGNGNA